MSEFDPSQLPSLTGRVAIATGGHSGLCDSTLNILPNILTLSSGLGTTTELLRHGAKVYIASRSRDKGRAAIALLKQEQATADVHFLPCDLSDLASVKTAASEFLLSATRSSHAETGSPSPPEKNPSSTSWSTTPVYVYASYFRNELMYG